MSIQLRGYYINLDNRTDRYDHFEGLKQTHPFLSNIERMSGLYNSNGAIGCALSHIKCLLALKDCSEDYVAVFEDDFCILDKRNFKIFQRRFAQIQTEPWDVITLTPRGISIETNEVLEVKGFKRIRDTQTMTGYIIKRAYVPILIETIKTGVRNLMSGGKADNNACDQAWKRLQDDSIFIYFNDIFGGQLPGWSSIEGRDVNYNARFIQQTNY